MKRKRNSEELIEDVDVRKMAKQKVINVIIVDYRLVVSNKIVRDIYIDYKKLNHISGYGRGVLYITLKRYKSKKSPEVCIPEKSILRFIERRMSRKQLMKLKEDNNYKTSLIH